MLVKVHLMTKMVTSIIEILVPKLFISYFISFWQHSDKEMQQLIYFPPLALVSYLYRSNDDTKAIKIFIHECTTQSDFPFAVQTEYRVIQTDIITNSLNTSTNSFTPCICKFTHYFFRTECSLMLQSKTIFVIFFFKPNILEIDSEKCVKQTVCEIF